MPNPSAPCFDTHLSGDLWPYFEATERKNRRRDNGKGIRNVCRQLVMLCRELDLFPEAVVAIDGSKFKAVNNRDRNFTDAKLQRRMQESNTVLPSIWQSSIRPTGKSLK
jgi:hypothetical protein